MNNTSLILNLDSAADYNEGELIAVDDRRGIVAAVYPRYNAMLVAFIDAYPMVEGEAP